MVNYTDSIMSAITSSRAATLPLMPEKRACFKEVLKIPFNLFEKNEEKKNEDFAINNLNILLLIQ